MFISMDRPTGVGGQIATEGVVWDLLVNFFFLPDSPVLAAGHYPTTHVSLWSYRSLWRLRQTLGVRQYCLLVAGLFRVVCSFVFTNNPIGLDVFVSTEFLVVLVLGASVAYVILVGVECHGVCCVNGVGFAVGLGFGG